MGIRLKNIKKLNDLAKAVEITLEKNVDVPIMKGIAEEMADVIVKRTKRSQVVKEPEGRISKMKQKADGAESTLTDTGQMLDSVIGRTAGRGRAVVTLKDSRKGGGSNIEIAGFHQFGTSKMPARPFLNLSKTEVDRLIKLLDEVLQEKIDRTLITVT